METKQARHEAEESLILAQFGQSRNISHKLQNGDQSSEGDSLQNTGDTNWNHYKPNTGANSMKRHRDNCNSPASGQGLFDQGAYMMNGELMNGELKHGLTEQSLLVHQTKKLKVDTEIQGNDDTSSSLLGNFPELTKATEFECKAPHREVKLDKRNCNFPNGDIFCLPRNKQVSIPNGAVSPSSTIESSPGDLLEKTLSQYYPEQVSIAQQTPGSNLDAVNGSLANKIPSEGAQHPSLTSGLSNSDQMPDSQQQQPGASGSAEGSKNYNSVNYVVNGYSTSFAAEHQQQQHQQRPRSYSGQELPLGQLPGMMSPTNTANSSQQHPNGPQCYPDDTNPQGIYVKANQGFTQNSFLECSAPLQTQEEGGYDPFPSSGIDKLRQSEGPRSGQHHGTDGGHQFRMQPQDFKQNAEKPHRDDSMGPMGPSLQQPCHPGLENGMENTLSKQRANSSCPTPHQRGWIELNSSHSPQQSGNGPSPQAQEQDMWRGYSAKPQSEQQAANHQIHSQMLEMNSPQGFQTQGVFRDSSQGSNSFQQQQHDCLPAQTHCVPAQHNTAPECQQSNAKAPQMQQPQKRPEHHNFPPNRQADSHYHTQMQSEHLCEDPDLQDILSPGLSTTKQQQHCHLQRPLSHPPQFEGQPKSTNYRPRSQPPPGQQQLQPAQPNNQHNQHTDHIAFSYNNSTEMQQLQQQQQRQYPPHSGSSNLKQFQPQQPINHCHQPNHTDFPQTSTQSQPHLPQGALNQQVTTQMYPKTEQHLQTSCTQFQRGPRLPLGPVSPHGDFQRHAALRMHLLQRQERQGPVHSPQSTSDHMNSFRAVKMENSTRFDLPCSQQQEHQLQMREAGIGGIQVKQENQQSQCAQSKRQESILASMEQSLRQYQLSPVFEKKSLVINPANNVKVESSGSVTILSTNTDLGGVESYAAASAPGASKKPHDSTPKKEHLLQSFMDSPMKLLDTPIKNLLDTPVKTQYDIASCHCVEQISEKDEGPYYTHLGSAPTVPGIREMMEKRSGLTGSALRIEKVIYTGKEGKSTQGCPIAKWVIRRSSVDEKLLVLVRERTAHTCETACIIVVILVWEGILPNIADRLYLELSETLKKHGALTQRRCALNEERTCACQGLNPDACGASFSFGCSWSMYYNGCKFARSKIPRKFKLLGDDVKEEERLDHNLQNLATLLGPLYKNLAPEAYGNQVEHEQRAPDCRLGHKEGRPFSGVTACLDFCAHAHRDLHNMQGGSTVVCTLTSEDNREIGKIPEDEQLHVLPLYKASKTDEFGSEEGQQEKIKSGAIQVLSAFRRQVRMLAEPAKSCRQKKLDAKKAAANKNAMLDSSNDKAEKALLAKSKAGTYENITHSTPMAGTVTGHIPGAMGATYHPGQPTHHLGIHPQQLQQQHQSILPPYPGSPNAANYPRFPNHPGSFPSTSKPGSLYPHQPPTPASPYPSPLHVPNSYINGSNRPYPGYQCNGGMPLDNYHPYYTSNQKHLDMYRQQRPVLYSEQQYGAHQRYDVTYPPRYNEPGLQVNGYNACSMRPVHPMRPYGPYGPNGASEPQFMDPLSRAPSAHGGLDYTAAVSKGNQFGGYQNPYLSRSPQILPPGQDPFHMQIKTEMSMPSPQISSQLGGGCLNRETQPGVGLPNGSLMGSGIKQEPGTPQAPTTPKKPEMWSDNEHNFLDPDIGGVAVAPSHGSVLIECAKRELHATTPLKNPDRNHPTRISLVFYQHKNMNEAKHGLALWEAKMAEKAREKEEDAERNGGEGTPSKGSKKGVKREHLESTDPSVPPPYKRFIQALMEGSLSCTTNTYVSTSPYAFTKVTGPYSKFV
ncbi:methylcytosine dioxygenase TET2 isoform X1 [Hippoglossus stenolepis]|uniref:methylcytosine dioxygenase TET2 isoform X1 n=1 Tax=Hippoglossus stenolepis TaxID=195615 RepID=UPI00159C7557|nr:methylcytosine dioxygenase TET2 isoform X1 [Hippoglossus stenolepis]